MSARNSNATDANPFVLAHIVIALTYIAIALTYIGIALAHIAIASAYIGIIIENIQMRERCNVNVLYDYACAAAK